MHEANQLLVFFSISIVFYSFLLLSFMFHVSIGECKTIEGVNEQFHRSAELFVLHNTATNRTTPS